MLRVNKNNGSFISTIRSVYQQPYFPSILILIFLLIISFILRPGFFGYDIMKTNFIIFTPIILISIAQGIIVLSGSIDLSVGSAMSLCVVIAASIMTDSKLNVALVVLLMIIIAMILGLFNGFIIGKLKLSPLISTYASSAIFFGIAMFIMPIPGGYVPKFFYKFYTSSILNFIPAPSIILIIGIIICIIITKTSYYKHIYAVGGNPDAAYSSGIRVSNVKILAHLIAGIFVGLASVCLLMSVASGDPRGGQGYLLNSIGAVVIGGISMKGGKGNIWGTIIGAIVLGLVMNIVFYANAPSSYQSFIKGLLIILALSIASIPKLREERYKV